MQARGVAAAVGVEREPDVSADLLLEDENVMPAYRGHFRCGSGARKTEPIRRQIQRWNNSAEQMQRRAASAKGPWTPRRTPTNYAAGRNVVTPMMVTRFSGQRQRNKRHRRNQKSQHL